MIFGRPSGRGSINYNAHKHTHTHCSHASCCCCSEDVRLKLEKVAPRTVRMYSHTAMGVGKCAYLPPPPTHPLKRSAATRRHAQVHHVTRVSRTRGPAHAQHQRAHGAVLTSETLLTPPCFFLCWFFCRHTGGVCVPTCKYCCIERSDAHTHTLRLRRQKPLLCETARSINTHAHTRSLSLSLSR